MIQRASDRPLVATLQQKGEDMVENVKEIEGQELDVDVEPTAEEIAAAEASVAEEEE